VTAHNILLRSKVFPLTPMTSLSDDHDVPPQGTETGDLETTKGAVIQGNDSDAPKEAPVLNGKPEEDENSMPPNLEALISGDCLPDFIDVYNSSTPSRVSLFHEPSDPLKSFIEQYPVRFMRKYPPRTPKDKDDQSVMLDPSTTGRLDLRHNEYLGSGNHSQVTLAPLTLPSRVDAPSVRGAVAVKIARSDPEEHKMLRYEAKIYEAFPRELQEGTSDQPPVVPKFYGYYMPSREGFDSQSYDDKFTEEDRKAVWEVIEGISPLLLLEACGKPIQATGLSCTDRETIFGLLDRLHAANFVQGSFYERNILVQPGPLGAPRPERSYQKPSYRFVDFGRGECPSVGGLKITELESDVKSERQGARRRITCHDCENQAIREKMLGFVKGMPCMLWHDYYRSTYQLNFEG